MSDCANCHRTYSPTEGSILLGDTWLPFFSQAKGTTRVGLTFMPRGASICARCTLSVAKQGHLDHQTALSEVLGVIEHINKKRKERDASL